MRVCVESISGLFGSVLDLAGHQSNGLFGFVLGMQHSSHLPAWNCQVVEAELTRMGFGRDEFDWALSIFHSRSFVVGQPATHLTVPGIDMANMSWDPSAIIRYACNYQKKQHRSAVRLLGSHDIIHDTLHQAR